MAGVLTNRQRRASVITLLLAMSVPGAAEMAAGGAYPLEYWALREVISNVRVSPDGRHLALLKIPTKDGDPILEVYDAGDLGKTPFRVNSDPMELRSVDWVNDDNLVVSLRQKVRDRIEGFNEGVYETLLGVLDIEQQKFETFGERNVSFEHRLPDKPGKIVISFNEGSEEDSKVAEPFRPRSYHEFDLKRGTKALLIRGKLLLGNIEFDGNGHPWLARGFDIARGDFLWYLRKPGESGWDEFHRLSENEFEDFIVEGFDETDRNIVFVQAQNGYDKRGLWEFNADAGEFGELIYRRGDVDVAGVRMHSNPWTNPDTIVGVGYFKDRLHIEYFDDGEKAIYEQLAALIPHAYTLRITSRSRDGQTLTIYNQGPRDPGSYYLVRDGKLRIIGSRQPLLKSEELADVEYITYKARDGRDIPAFLTMPKGAPPYPTVVLPHGGPFVNETVDYDEWGQLLANNGYLVLQPQYRGSTGYGREFYTSAFIDGGQGGYQMQDDKDDGALNLVKEGLADRNRLAMFGWSYGGYAALVAASRAPQIYQCVVAGAAVTDPLMQVNYYRDLLRGRYRDEQLNMWRDSVSPIEETSKVNVPLLLIHGDVDQRVPPEHATKYRRALDKYAKSYKYVELEGADHFSSTLFFHHQLKLYESLIDFLKNDCGPGGL
jgi:dienelactone hydrolase